MKALLALDGHQVQTAANAKEALAVLGKSRFDLIILDYELPDITGDKLASDIKALAPQLPIIMLTACRETLALSEKPFVGVDLVLGKPIQSEELRRTVSQLLIKKSDRQSPSD